MLTIYFSNYCIFLPFIYLLSSYWYVFIKNNFFYIRKKPYIFEKIQKTAFNKKLNYIFLLKIGLIFNFIFILNFYTTKLTDNYFWWNHFYLNHVNSHTVFYVIIFSYVCLLILYFLKKQTLQINIEYIFAILNIMVLIPLLFYSNTVLTLFFSLEIITYLIFFKFSVSKFWFTKNTNHNIIKTKQTRLLPKYFINLLFFQYWSTFFSSVLFFFSILTILKLYGLVDWYFMNFLNKINFFETYHSTLELFLYFFPLFFGFFLKLGLTPFHFYKIETYKGLPLVTLFFYTIYYFCVYFVFFIFFLNYYLVDFIFLKWFYLFIIILLGTIYLISLLFQGFLIKSFFGYSTVINSINFILLYFIML